MCGIMGYVRTRGGKLPRRALMEALMVGIESRGMHAAGMATLGANGQTMWGKNAGSAHKFIKGNWWSKGMHENPRLLIGHARFATHGSPADNRNNHPFVSDNGRWMLIHNGVLNDPVSCDVAPRGECDSELILRMLDERGVGRTVKDMMTMSNSCYACLAIDADKRRMYVWRNEGSPLVVADLSDEAGGIYFASTAEILRAALRWVRIDPTAVTVYEIMPGVKYFFPVNTAPGSLDTMAKDGWLTVVPYVEQIEGVHKGMSWMDRAAERGWNRAFRQGDFDHYRNWPEA